VVSMPLLVVLVIYFQRMSAKIKDQLVLSVNGVEGHRVVIGCLFCPLAVLLRGYSG
jgi:ATP/ADP translocase